MENMGAYPGVGTCLEHYCICKIKLQLPVWELELKVQGGLMCEGAHICRILQYYSSMAILCSSEFAWGMCSRELQLHISMHSGPTYHTCIIIGESVASYMYMYM